MKSINLFWFKLSNGSSNYGDELNHFIVKELTGKKVNHIPYPYKRYKIPLIYLNNLINKKGYASFTGMLRSIFSKNVLFAIGSILQIHDRKGVVVWGSGIIQKNSKIHKATFKAVRGRETVKRLESLGYDVPDALGDPALLLPLLMEPAQKKHRIGIVPNYKQYEESLKKLVLPKDVILVDLRGSVQSVNDEMTSCEYIISTSLHGLIVAHAYNIPALWVDLNLTSTLAGDDIKFRDYFSSVNIVPYQPVIIDKIEIDFINNLIEDNKEKVLINNDLRRIQDKLLKTFPYDLKEKYRV